MKFKWPCNRYLGQLRTTERWFMVSTLHHSYPSHSTSVLYVDLVMNCERCGKPVCDVIGEAALCETCPESDYPRMESEHEEFGALAS